MTNTISEVQVWVEDDQPTLLIGTERRQAWEEQFQRMAERGDDKLLDDGDLLLTQWEEKDWEWH